MVRQKNLYKRLDLFPLKPFSLSASIGKPLANSKQRSTLSRFRLQDRGQAPYARVIKNITSDLKKIEFLG
jgi:hypothetical protein